MLKEEGDASVEPALGGEANLCHALLIGNLAQARIHPHAGEFCR